MKHILVAVFAWLLITGLVSAQAPTAAPAAGDANRGKDVFVKCGCSGCHDYSGQGGTGAATGPRLIGLPLTLPAFTTFLRSPARPQNMPPYTAKKIGRA